ncbi:uncharacterized protein [Drosophila tropicalis]|uniref:uncharacterized protein n=1 Tax=Drosophila tropicalis TaxID=46794 RepID=UPI0035ABDB8B
MNLPGTTQTVGNEGLRLKTFIILLSLIAFSAHSCEAHGRLIEPPSRASAWRYGFQTPPDYNDHELYCGGFTRQWKRNGGKCGECGDPWDMPQPRPHENGGQWGQGVVVRSYLPGSEFTIRVELTASHMGYFEFRLCPKPNAKQSCLDENVLHILGGSPAQPTPTDLDTRFYPRNGSRIYDIKARLPKMTCDQCVLQWRYVAGNNWGMCDDGNGAVGCGPQEEFRSCSDIALTTDARIPMRPVRPTYFSTARPSVKTSTTEENSEEISSNEMNYSLVIGLIIVLLILLFGLTGWYLYRYQNSKLKKWQNVLSKKFCQKKKIDSPFVGSTQRTIPSLFISANGLQKAENNCGPTIAPPVPPPRTKRNSKVKELSADESSVA